MKISYDWLKKYIDLAVDAEELSDLMTFSGIEVEEIIQLGTELKKIKVAQILDKKPHPNADKLSICVVDDGSTKLQVVCGAPNCSKNLKVAFAPVGTKIGEFKVKKAKLRGIESYGMICSEKELGISDNHDGIMELPQDAPLGSSLAEYMRYEDTVYDVEITPNRPDLLGIFGVARDLSAILNEKLHLPDSTIIESDNKIEDFLKLKNLAPKLCPRYTARVIKNVTIKESPDWMKKALLSVGLRPINNVVDVTNFVMLEMGHPLHAFDYSLLDGKEIIVRRAEAEEKFPALDEEIYKLSDSDLVIADAKKPVALAGVIGGQNSHITESTKTIVLEAASFLYSAIRKTAGKLNISTDSSYRFERDLPADTIDFVSQRAAHLIQVLAGGEVMQGMLDSYPVKQEELIVKLRPQRVELLLDLEISTENIIKYLEALQLKVIEKHKDEIVFQIPPFRKDLSREVDLIEEIIRLHGYNNVKTRFKPQTIMDRDAIFTRRGVKNILVNFGMSELVNWNFGDPEDLDKLQISEHDKRKKNVKLMNPLGKRFSIMRPTLLPDLLKNANYNLNHGQKDIKTFEMAKLFFRDKQKLAEETYQVTGLLIGKTNETFWKSPVRELDFFDIKGLMTAVLAYLDLSQIKYEKSAEPYYQQGIAADVLYNGTKIASLGKLDPIILREFDIEETTYSFDIAIGKILDIHRKELPVYEEIPKFPPVLRDISFVVPRKFNLAEIEAVIKNTNRKLISKVVLFDQYTGKNIEPDKRSLSFNIVFSSSTKTLTDEFINGIISKVIKNLETEFKIILR